jgi:uroporphyrinogen decarboxylase
MKIVGGVGNGVFETIQDLVPFTELAYLQADDPDLFSDLWVKVGDTLAVIWKQFLEEYNDLLAVGRFGDDLGFKSAPLLAPNTIREHVIPQYQKIISQIKGAGIPFLLHSCGCIFDVMDDIIDETGIDAKHSNEDAIAPFGKWVGLYGGRIGNFGGLDMDVICRSREDDLRSYIREVVIPIKDIPGLAVGSGNQIADYIPPENFIAMIEELRTIRNV